MKLNVGGIYIVARLVQIITSTLLQVHVWEDLDFNNTRKSLTAFSLAMQNSLTFCYNKYGGYS